MPKAKMMSTYQMINQKDSMKFLVISKKSWESTAWSLMILDGKRYKDGKIFSILTNSFVDTL
jgi:hypothetical protein